MLVIRAFEGGPSVYALKSVVAYLEAVVLTEPLYIKYGLERDDSGQLSETILAHEAEQCVDAINSGSVAVGKAGQVCTASVVRWVGLT
jgi:hypothetical protein